MGVSWGSSAEETRKKLGESLEFVTEGMRNYDASFEQTYRGTVSGFAAQTIAAEFHDQKLTSITVLLPADKHAAQRWSDVVAALKGTYGAPAELVPFDSKKGSPLPVAGWKCPNGVALMATLQVAKGAESGAAQPAWIFATSEALDQLAIESKSSLKVEHPGPLGLKWGQRAALVFPFMAQRFELVGTGLGSEVSDGVRFKVQKFFGDVAGSPTYITVYFCHDKLCAVALHPKEGVDGEGPGIRADLEKKYGKPTGKMAGGDDAWLFKNQAQVSVDADGVFFFQKLDLMKKELAKPDKDL